MAQNNTQLTLVSGDEKKNASNRDPATEAQHSTPALPSTTTAGFRQRRDSNRIVGHPSETTTTTQPKDAGRRSSIGILYRSRRQSAPNASSSNMRKSIAAYASASRTESGNLNGRPSATGAISALGHGNATQIMQQPDFSHISALTMMALPSLMASYHASMCQPPAPAKLHAEEAAPSTDVVGAPSVAPSDGGVSTLLGIPSEVLHEEYDRLNNAMSPDMEAEALGGNQADQDYSMYFQSCKLDVAIETATTTRKQLRTVNDYAALIGCFLMMMMLEPVGLSSGVFVDPLREAFDASSSQVSFALSLQLGGLLAVTPFDNWLNVRLGMQTVLMLGAAISALSFLLTAVCATHIWHFYIGYGFFGGLALGMAEYSLLAGSAFLFPGRGDLIALICVGVSLGNICIPPILSAVISACEHYEPAAESISTTIAGVLLDAQQPTTPVTRLVATGTGWRGGLYVVAGAQTLIILLALTFRIPQERFFHPPPALIAACGKNFLPKAIFNKQFLLLSTFYFFWIMHQQFFSYGPSIVQAAVQDSSINSGLILSVYSIAQLFGRLGTVYVNSKPLPISLRAYTTSVAVAVMGVALLVLGALVNATSKFVIFCIPAAVAGFCSGIVWASFSWIMLEVFGPFQFGSAINFVNPSGGASNYIGIFVGGVIATETEKPEAPLYLASAGLFIAAILLAVLGRMQSRRQIADYELPAQMKPIMLLESSSMDEMWTDSAGRQSAAQHAAKKTSFLEEVESDPVVADRKNLVLDFGYEALDPEPFVRLLVELNRHKWNLNNMSLDESSLIELDKNNVSDNQPRNINTSPSYGWREEDDHAKLYGSSSMVLPKNSSDVLVDGYRGDNTRGKFCASSSVAFTQNLLQNDG